MNAKTVFFILSGLSLIAYLAISYSESSGSAKIALLSGGQEKNANVALKFNGAGDFTILQFTDLHYGKDDEINKKTTEVQEYLINLVKPDLVVITGDAISGNDWDKSKPFYQQKWEQFTAPYKKLKVPYAYTLGNHDTDADFTGEQIEQLEKTHPYSLYNGTSVIDPEGNSNYVIPVYSSIDWLKTTPAALLWMFDTKKENCLDTPNSWGCITQNQIDWFKGVTDANKNGHGERISGLAFFHIPLPEYMTMWNEALTYGNKDDNVNCPKVNTGAFEAFLEKSSIKGTFCGHDHTNDYGGNYKGIELVYGRKTGYGAKGPLGYKGARIIRLKEQLSSDMKSVDFTFVHEIVEENGNIIPNPAPRWQGDKMHQEICHHYNDPTF